MKCVQCGKEVEKPIMQEVYYRTRELRTGRFGRTKYEAVVKTKTVPVCSNECGSRYQMSLEG